MRTIFDYAKKGYEITIQSSENDSGHLVITMKNTHKVCAIIVTDERYHRDINGILYEIENRIVNATSESQQSNPNQAHYANAPWHELRQL